MIENECYLVFKLEHSFPPLVKKVLEDRGACCKVKLITDKTGWREWEERDKAAFNLFWRSSRFKPSELNACGENQKLNHFPKTGGITRKVLL